MVNGNRWKKISMWQLERPTKMTVTRSGASGPQEERRKALKVKMRRKPRSHLHLSCWRVPERARAMVEVIGVAGAVATMDDTKISAGAETRLLWRTQASLCLLVCQDAKIQCQHRHMRNAQIFTLEVCVLTYKQTQWGLCSASTAKSRMSNSSPKSRNRWLPCWNSRTSMMRAGSKKTCTRTCQRDWIRRTASSWDLPFRDILLLAKQHVFFVFCCWTSAAGDYCRSCTKLSMSLTTMRMFQRSQKMAFSFWSIQQSQYVLAFHWHFWHFWHWVFDWLGSQYKRKSWSVRRWGSGKMKEATKRRLGLTLIFLGAMLQVVIETLTEKPRNVYRIVAASRRASWVECNLSRFYFECVPRISSSQWLQWKIICLSWPVTSCHWLAVILHKTRHSRRSAQLLECHFPCCRVCCNSQRSIGIARRMQGAGVSPTVKHSWEKIVQKRICRIRIVCICFFMGVFIYSPYLYTVYLTFYMHFSYIMSW